MVYIKEETAGEIMRRLFKSKLFLVLYLTTLFAALTAQIPAKYQDQGDEEKPLPSISKKPDTKPDAKDTSADVKVNPAPTPPAKEAAPTPDNTAQVSKDLAPIKNPPALKDPVAKKNFDDTTKIKEPPPKSLMFTDSELQDVDRALDSYENNRLFVVNDEHPVEEKKEIKVEDNAKSFIYLNSILYFSSENWSVWINDKKISSTTNKHGAEFYVKSISPNEASILWTISISKWKILSGKKSEDSAPFINKDNQVEVIFNLKPNQTFMLVSGAVVEGRV